MLISTDVLSEGLNLQDATRLINYDLHWNPVRLMQRIGRVDRRMNPEIEARLVADHPELKGLRGRVAFWNFLPPGRTGRTAAPVPAGHQQDAGHLPHAGHRGPHPADAGRRLRSDQGTERAVRRHAVGGRAAAPGIQPAGGSDHPELAAQLPGLPLKVFSGQVSPRPGARAVFFCYRIPRPDPDLIEAESGQPRWSDAAGLHGLGVL